MPLYRLPEDVGPHKVRRLYAPLPCHILMSPQLSKPPCSPTKRRRGASRNLSRSARQRHCARADCCIHTAARPLTSLDDLPWISALRIEPDPTNPWDIADLSCLNPTIEEEHTSSGPVRRRKTSLRLDPLAQPKDEEMYCRDIPFPFIGRALFQDMTPQTPPPRDRFTPSNVFFHGLYPILPSEVEISSRSSEVETPL